MNGVKSWLVPIYNNGTAFGSDGAIPCYYTRYKEKQQLISYIARKAYCSDNVTAIYEISTFDFKTHDLKDVAKYGKLVYKKEVNGETSNK